MFLRDNMHSKANCNDRAFAFRYQFKLNLVTNWRFHRIGSLNNIQVGSTVSSLKFGEKGSELFCYFLKTGIVLSSYHETMLTVSELWREFTAIKLDMEVSAILGELSV